jgi:hypothetical protein
MLNLIKVARCVCELIKYAMNKAKKISILSEYTSFSSITSPSDDSDPFDGEVVYLCQSC